MKKILIVLIGITFTFSLEVLAQKKPIVKKPKTTANQMEKANSAGEKEFVSTEGKFKIMFPAPPEINSTDEGEGNFRLKSVSHRAYGGVVGYGVTYTDSFSSARVNDETNLEGLRKLIASNGKVIKETKLTLGEITGWEIVYQKIDKSIAQHRIYYLGKRSYEVVAVFPSLFGADPELAIAKYKTNVDKFFDSFQILK
jgi:hypothetical protein